MKTRHTLQWKTGERASRTDQELTCITGTFSYDTEAEPDGRIGDRVASTEGGHGEVEGVVFEFEGKDVKHFARGWHRTNEIRNHGVT